MAPGSAAITDKKKNGLLTKLGAQRRNSSDSTGQWHHEDDIYRHTIIDLSLRTFRYVLVVTFGLGVAILYTTLTSKGFRLEKGISDSYGSSTAAKAAEEKYNTISGTVMIVVGKVFEFYSETLLFPTLVTYLLNCHLFPGDDPRRVNSSTKSTVLFWAFRFVLILINVGTASIYVQYVTTGVAMVMNRNDLEANSTIATIAFDVTIPSKSYKHTVTNVTDTILRTAIAGYTKPFELDSECTGGKSRLHPTVNDFDATSAVLGFPVNDWNTNILFSGKQPVTTVDFTYGDYKQDKTKYTQKVSNANIDLDIVFELFVQGSVVFERAIADSDLTSAFYCDSITGQITDFTTESGSASAASSAESASSTEATSMAGSGVTTTTSGSGSGITRHLQEASSGSSSSFLENIAYEEGSVEFISGRVYEESMPIVSEGVTICQGMTPSAPYFAEMMDSNKRTLDRLLIQIVNVTDASFGELLELDLFKFTFSKYKLTDHVFMDTVTIDFPLSSNVFAADPYTLYPDFCGLDNCIAVVDGEQSLLPNKIALTTYVKDCDLENLMYDVDLLNFFPSNCVRQNDSVFLYGLGSYLRAKAMNMNETTGYPQLEGPEAYISLSFAKLSWEMYDMAEELTAKCDVDSNSGCRGILVPYDDNSGAVLTGENALAKEHITNNNSFLNPLRLVGLSPVYLIDRDSSDLTEYHLMYINKANIDSVNIANTTKWNSNTCDPVFDSYIKHIETNYLLLESSLQPMYTAAIYYLFQNGVPTTVESSDDGKLAHLQLSNNLEEHEIAFTIPITSASATFVGCGLMLLLMVIVIKSPRGRIRLTPNTTAAAQYVQILTDHNLYPDAVNDKILRFPNGEALRMDDYVVDHIVLHAKQDESKKIYL